MSHQPHATGLARGTRLGPYEIVAPLSAGGMATLYLGRRVGAAGFQRHVAIKVVHQHMARDPGFVSMFLDEARLAARIQHPNVVHTEELGEERGTHFIAMEYLRGCSLAQFLQKLASERRGLAPELAAYIAMKVADGLHAAHEIADERGQHLGVVHRDISPQNIFLTYDGQVKLIDFGVAKVRGRDRGTLMGSLKGKIRYMAPEQAASQPVDRRTDVYALGIVLWESLTHQRLFSGGDDIEALERVKNPHVASPSALAPAIGPGLDECVMTALARDPDRRFQTALAFRRAIGGGCPAALEVDAERLAALLVSAMREEIERERQEVPAVADVGVVAMPSEALTRGGQALTRASPAISAAMITGGVAVARSRSLRAVATPRVAPSAAWRPAAVAAVALTATLVGVALAWGVASRFAGPRAAEPPALAASPAVPVASPTAEVVMAPSAAPAAADIPSGIEPPWPEDPVPEGDELAVPTPSVSSRHSDRHRSESSRYPEPPPPYHAGPGGPPPDPYGAPPRGGYPPSYGPDPRPGPGRYDERPPPPEFREPPFSEPLPGPRVPAPGARINGR